MSIRRCLCALRARAVENAESARSVIYAIFRLIACILTFRDKKYRILTFRDKTESYLTAHSLSGSLCLFLALSGSHSSLIWLPLALSGSLSGSLWLAVRLSLAHSSSLWLTLAPSGSLSGSLWLHLALSGSLWLAQALYGSPNLLTKPLLGSQGPCSARSSATALQHFLQPWCYLRANLKEAPHTKLMLSHVLNGVCYLPPKLHFTKCQSLLLHQIQLFTFTNC